jgi:hypothetical protein
LERTGAGVLSCVDFANVLVADFEMRGANMLAKPPQSYAHSRAESLFS